MLSQVTMVNQQTKEGIFRLKRPVTRKKSPFRDLAQCFPAGVPWNFRVPRVVARGSAET